MNTKYFEHIVVYLSVLVVCVIIALFARVVALRLGGDEFTAQIVFWSVVAIGIIVYSILSILVEGLFTALVKFFFPKKQEDKTNNKASDADAGQVVDPGSREPESKNWLKTQEMSKKLNKAGKDVIFLAEYKDKPSADALLMFKDKYSIADFKYITSTKSSTLANELKNTYKQIGTVVLQMEKGDLGMFRDAIEEIKRKEYKLGNIILVNKYGKIVEIPYSELKNNGYMKILRGFF